MTSIKSFLLSSSLLACIFLCSDCTDPAPPILSLSPDTHISMIGGNICSRMINYGHFETELHSRYPEHRLYIRNMCDGGDTPGFRPHSGRPTPWPWIGAEIHQKEYAHPSGSEGHFEYPDEWLTRHETDIVLAFFGYSESFAGADGLERFEDELAAFIEHSLAQKYNGADAPQLVLISPMAMEDLSGQIDVPNGSTANANLKPYSQSMSEVAAEYGVPFLDLYAPSLDWVAGRDNMTIDGFQLTDQGYERLSGFLADRLFGEGGSEIAAQTEKEVHELVNDKNWYWHNDYKIPNGVHVFGRRYDPFGPDNYPYELQKTREMTACRDTAIWMAAQGLDYDLSACDATTIELPEVETNFVQDDYGRGNVKYRYGDEALEAFTTAPGYEISLFASEGQFPDLANPVQLSFDNKGRLWVATMPSYPHYKVGDERPDDKIIILTDTDGDGRADEQHVYADGLHIPVGFEISHDGVYVTQGTNLIFLEDTDGDDTADRSTILLSGFDDHDTHHAISAYCADPSGAFYMGEGIFLHTNVETPYGTVRGTNGGFYRYNPARRHLERTAQLAIPNPWGTAFDEWGQPFFLETSGPAMRWMLPGTVKSRYGVFTDKSKDLIDEEHAVRPTSGIEIISSRHFPEEVQGDILLNNTIGFLGTRQHSVADDSSGYDVDFRQDLFRSDDPNVRPVDLEFAPDGSLYIVDWHNVLVGHMQHNARDPLRDHVHGRIYRVTYPDRPLVEPYAIDGESIPHLLDGLTEPEYRTRYRVRRELRGRDVDEVLSAINTWVEGLDESDDRYEHHLLEALWVSWGMNQVHEPLLRQLLDSDDHRARAAAVRVLRYMHHQVAEAQALFEQVAADEHGRVRMEAIVAASWLPKEEGLAIIDIAKEQPIDSWIKPALATAEAHLNGHKVKPKKEAEIETHLTGADRETYVKGKEIYEREGYCATCHQESGKGIRSSGFPPLVGTRWVLEDEERLIKLAMKGLYGPIKVLDRDYPGQVPMTPYEGLLDDEEMAAVLTYVRNSFGNKASVISADQVQKVRTEIADKKGFYTPEELLKDHPHTPLN